MASQKIYTAPPGIGEATLGKTLPDLLYETCARYENARLLIIASSPFVRRALALSSRSAVNFFHQRSVPIVSLIGFQLAIGWFRVNRTGDHGPLYRVDHAVFLGEPGSN